MTRGVSIDQEVNVQTGCRIHFGLAEIYAGAPHRYSGLGLALESPGFSLTAQSTQKNHTSSRKTAGPLDPEIVLLDAEALPAETADRILRVAKSVALGQSPDFDNVRSRDESPSTLIRLICASHIPLHHGLGAGTQLALAVARAVSGLIGQGESLTRVDSNQRPQWQEQAAYLAQLAQRGKRSAIGISAFSAGGLVLDRGYTATESNAGRPIDCTSTALPEHWRIVLGFPDTQAGLAGQRESAAMSEVANRPNPSRNRMLAIGEQLVSDQTTSTDFDSFTGVLEEYLNLASQLFAPVQGGAYNGPEITATVDAFRNVGLRAVGQSSWGPCVFGFAKSQDDAMIAERRLREYSTQKLLITKPSKSGADVRYQTSRD